MKTKDVKILAVIENGSKEILAHLDIKTCEHMRATLQNHADKSGSGKKYIIFDTMNEFDNFKEK